MFAELDYRPTSTQLHFCLLVCNNNKHQLRPTIGLSHHQSFAQKYWSNGRAARILIPTIGIMDCFDILTKNNYASNFRENTKVKKIRNATLIFLDYWPLDCTLKPLVLFWLYKYTPTSTKWLKFGRFIVKRKLMKLRPALDYPLKKASRFLAENRGTS